MKPTMNVWIELQEPDENYTGKEIADAATRMIRRLGSERGYFQFSPTKMKGCHYRYIAGSEGGITPLADNGKWFNLGYFGRKPAEDQSIVEVIGEIS